MLKADRSMLLMRPGNRCATGYVLGIGALFGIVTLRRARLRGNVALGFMSLARAP